MNQPLNLGAAFGVALSANRELAKSAAYIEAGRIVNNKLEQLIAPKLPMMLRGYAQTSFGRLAMANLLMVGVQRFRPDNAQLQKLGYAAVTESYGAVLRDFNIEGLIDGFLADSSIASALNMVPAE